METMKFYMNKVNLVRTRVFLIALTALDLILGIACLIFAPEEAVVCAILFVCAAVCLFCTVWFFWKTRGNGEGVALEIADHSLTVKGVEIPSSDVLRVEMTVAIGTCKEKKPEYKNLEYLATLPPQSGFLGAITVHTSKKKYSVGLINDILSAYLPLKRLGFPVECWLMKGSQMTLYQYMEQEEV